LDTPVEILDIGGLNPNNQNFNGSIQELILYPVSNSSNRSGIETNINNHYSIYDRGLLEDYPGAIAAYSVRQLTTAATASMNIRRDSNQDELVIGFTSNGDLDTGSIETFCAGTECYVDMWYDQSGNGNDAPSPGASSEPLIYTSSALITDNGKPAIDFGALGYGFRPSFTSSINSEMALFITAHGQNTITGNPGSYNGIIGGPGMDKQLTIFTGYSNYLTFNNGGNQVTMTQVNQNDVINVQKLWTYYSTTSSMHGMYDDTEWRSKNITTTIPNVGITRIGAPSHFDWDGTIQEMIFYNTDISSSVSNIKTNINSYFNIY
jgi:hypothetical protein